MSRTTSILKTIAIVALLVLLVIIGCRVVSATGQPEVVPVLCTAGLTLVDYEDGAAMQKPVCKGEVENTTPELVPTSDGGMMEPLTGKVFYSK